MNRDAVIPAAIGFLAGVAGYSSGIEVRFLIGVLVAAFVFAVLFSRKHFFAGVVAIALSFAGFAYANRYDEKHASRLPDSVFNSKVDLVGDVIDDPDIGVEKTRVIVRPIRIGGVRVPENYPDRILARLGPGVDVDYGDRIKIEGIIERPENFVTETDREFDYENYLALHDVYGIVRAYDFGVVSEKHGSALLRTLYAIKKEFVRVTRRVFQAPESGLIAGIMIGEKSLLPSDILADFQAAGLTHMIVLSGYNVTIVAMTVSSMFAWLGLGYRARRVGALVVIPLFILMTGLDASAVRAGIMAMIAFSLQIMARPSHTMRIVLLTLSAMVIANPRTLLHDPSLHLSYLAFLGLIYMTPVVAEYSSRFGEWFGLRDLVTETLAVQIVVMPYIVYMNGTVSALLLAANVFAVPLSPIAMGIGFGAVTVGMVSVPLGTLLAIPAQWILSYIIWVGRLVASVNAASFVIPPFGIWWMIGGYAFLTLFLIRVHGASAARNGILHTSSESYLST